MSSKKKNLLWRPKIIIQVKKKTFCIPAVLTQTNQPRLVGLVAKHLIGRRKCRVINYEKRLPTHRHVDAHNSDLVRKGRAEFFVPFRLQRSPFTSCTQSRLWMNNSGRLHRAKTLIQWRLYSG